MDEKTRIAAATVRYRKAADVLRSIIGFNPNAHASVAADYGGLATLLLVKTQLSKVEYIEAIADRMERAAAQAKAGLIEDQSPPPALSR